MKIKNMTKEELETMPFDDIAYIILKEKSKKMKTNDIFQIICDNLELGENAFLEQIGDFFTLLATERRFVQLPKGYWDLRENHAAKVVIDDAEDDIDDELLLDDDKDISSEDGDDNDFYDDIKDSEDDEAEDDLKDLVVIDEGYEDEESDI